MQIRSHFIVIYNSIKYPSGRISFIQQFINCIMFLKRKKKNFAISLQSLESLEHSKRLWKGKKKVFELCDVNGVENSCFSNQTKWLCGAHISGRRVIWSNSSLIRAAVINQLAFLSGAATLQPLKQKETLPRLKVGASGPVNVDSVIHRG